MDNPSAMVLGVPDFGSEAPVSRTKGRRIGELVGSLETLWGGIRGFALRFSGVSHCGKPRKSWRRFEGGDVSVSTQNWPCRLFWQGVRPINLKVPVRYFSAAEGGTSHFRYVRDNLCLLKAHTFLVIGMLPRLPRIWRLRGRA